MPDLRGYPDDLLARLEEDMTAAGKPVADADVERALKAARGFLDGDTEPLVIVEPCPVPPAAVLAALGLEVVEGE